MSKKVKLVVAIFFLAVLGYIVTSPMATSKVSCEVCVDFKGRQACRTARGPTRDGAIVTARDNACAQIVSGRTENILCGGSQPASIQCSDAE
jgi:hypothetical protein